jgi:hypothetical protein
MILPDVVVDLPELDELESKVRSAIEQWTGAQCRTERLPAKSYS